VKYVCLVYHDEKELQAMSDAELDAHIGACMDWLGDLETSGRHIYSAGLQASATAATVRLRGGRTVMTDGPFAETKEALLGFTIVDARDLNEAIHIAEQLDAARIGSVEVRPVFELGTEAADPGDRRRAAAIGRGISRRAAA
jgi:hypothetical protein